MAFSYTIVSGKAGDTLSVISDTPAVFTPEDPQFAPLVTLLTTGDHEDPITRDQINTLLCRTGVAPGQSGATATDDQDVVTIDLTDAISITDGRFVLNGQVVDEPTLIEHALVDMVTQLHAENRSPGPAVMLAEVIEAIADRDDREAIGDWLARTPEAAITTAGQILAPTLAMAKPESRVKWSLSMVNEKAGREIAFLVDGRGLNASPYAKATVVFDIEDIRAVTDSGLHVDDLEVVRIGDVGPRPTPVFTPLTDTAGISVVDIFLTGMVKLGI